MKTVSEIMSKNVISVSPEETVQKLIGIMEKHNVKELPVLENSVLKGMVSYHDLVSLITAVPVKVKTIMFKPPVIKPTDEIKEALKKILETGVSALPVVEKNKVIGIISDFDILNDYSSGFDSTPVSDILNSKILPVKSTDSINKARRVMDYYNSSVLPVVDSRNKYIGAVYLKDILGKCLIREKTKQSKGEVSGSRVKFMSEEVGNICRKEVQAVSASETLSSVLKNMLKLNSYGVPVINREKEPIGVVLRKDFVKYMEKMIEQKGVFVNFSGIELTPSEIITLKSIVSDHIRRLTYLTKKIDVVELHIKPIHDSEKPRYEINLKVQKPGKGIYTKEEGYDLFFTLERLMQRLEQMLYREFKS